MLVRVVFEQQSLALFKQVRNTRLLLRNICQRLFCLTVMRIAHNPPLRATITRDKRPSVRERQTRAVAAVRAKRTGQVLLLLIGQICHSLKANEPRLHQRIGRAQRFHVLLRKHGRTQSAHKTRIRRTHDLFAQVLFERTQNGIVHERTALNHNRVAQVVKIRQANNFREHVFDDRTAKTRHDIGWRASPPLLGNNIRIHEHRAATSQLSRAFRRERRLSNVMRGNTQRRREILQEAAATRRTRLVDHDVRNNAV